MPWALNHSLRITLEPIQPNWSFDFGNGTEKWPRPSISWSWICELRFDPLLPYRKALKPMALTEGPEACNPTSRTEGPPEARTPKDHKGMKIDPLIFEPRIYEPTLPRTEKPSNQYHWMKYQIPTTQHLSRKIPIFPKHPSRDCPPKDLKMQIDSYFTHESQNHQNSTFTRITKDLHV